MEYKNIKIEDYLKAKGIEFKEINGELIAKCPFNNCDQDSTGSEAHWYIKKETGQFDCKKCGQQGNLFTLAKFFGDTIMEENNQKVPTIRTLGIKLVEDCHKALPARVREYLINRGISDQIINEKKIGWFYYASQYWITFPIRGLDGKYFFFKLRQDPLIGNDKMTYPTGIRAQIYDWETLGIKTDYIIIAEGEGDALSLLSKGIPAITSTHGAMTFPENWLEYLPKEKKYYICYDTDEAGKKGSEKVANLLYKNSFKEIYKIKLPELSNQKMDITDYFIKMNGTTEDLFNKYAVRYPEPIDTSGFNPLSSKDIIGMLETTIKGDDDNKLATFLCQLSAYTEENQFNISFNAPSSTGKSFIPLQIADLFPEEDILKLGNCSPTAFFHEQGRYDSETNTIFVDLSRKILIFTDMPHNDLLTRLRSMLSHDEKIMYSKITDKNQKGGNRTKTVALIGFPSVIFCTAGLSIDEQEATRFLLLSPEINQEKIRAGVKLAIKKGSNNEDYKKCLDRIEVRNLLIQRIKAIKQENIGQIIIEDKSLIEEKFFAGKEKLKPRHQRDIKRLMAFVKTFALLNLWWRKRENNTIVADQNDIEEGFAVWDKISGSQELNLPPYVLNFYKEIILSLYEEKNKDRNKDLANITGAIGITINEELDKHYKIYGRPINRNQLKDINTMLQNASLIFFDKNPHDNRGYWIFPMSALNDTSGGGVNSENDPDKLFKDF